MGDTADIVIVGAGIAGASLAFELAADHRVILLERENRPGYHSTGRSAAMLIESYGTDAVRGLTKASRAFFEKPPEGFSETPLLSPRGYLHIAREDQLPHLDALEKKIRPHVPPLRRLNGKDVVAAAPLIDPGYVAAGLLEPDAMAIDDAALHQGYLKRFKRRAGTLVTDADVLEVDPGAGGTWRLKTQAGRFRSTGAGRRRRRLDGRLGEALRHSADRSSAQAPHGSSSGSSGKLRCRPLAAPACQW